MKRRIPTATIVGVVTGEQVQIGINRHVTDVALSPGEDLQFGPVGPHPGDTATKKLHFPAIGINRLDEPEIAKPTSNVYLDHKQPWVVIDDSLKKYDQLP